jgi:hypothetical protein
MKNLNNGWFEEMENLFSIGNNYINNIKSIVVFSDEKNVMIVTKSMVLAIMRKEF